MSRQKILVDKEALREVLIALRDRGNFTRIKELRDMDNSYMNNPIGTLADDYHRAELDEAIARADLRRLENDQSAQEVHPNEAGNNPSEGRGA